ncbi:hypothetical protein HY008_01370 [Candidatus Woesebacteria bacterium]|nr:hypothetical protein [Candidatus Woesebacteria bacterium]
MKLAQLNEPLNLRPSEQFTNLGNITFQALLRAAIVGILIVAAVIFFFMLIIGGIKWITSGGDKAQTESARSQITAALIGLVVVFSAWAIITLINAFFGIDLFSLNLPSPVV